MRSLSILVVDDDKNIVFTLGEILKLHNWDVDIAEDGYKAVELVKEKKYDLVLLDVKMPGIDGIQTFSEIKKIQPEAIVFLMTAGTVDNLAEMQKTGVFTIIQKPIDVTKIIKMISDFEKKGIVLVVDDSENDRTLLTDILTSKGFRVVSAKTGAEAIDLAERNDFDVIILDIRLPDMDGISVLEKIKEFKPASSIITVTGYCLDELIENIVSKGAYTCLLKPFDVELLLREINNLMSKKTIVESDKGPEEKKVNVLVVEDDDNIRGTLKEILAEEGYAVSTASTVKKAEDELVAKNYDVVISDLSVGKSSGLSLVDPSRKKDKTTVFLLLTGQGSLETAVEAVKKNVDEYILKPIKPAELIHKVKSYLEKQKLTREKDYLLGQLQQSNMRLLEIIKTDELTGLFNRRHLFEQLHAEMQRSKRQKTSLCLMMCDIDGFKKYNDTYGHLEGDKVLKEVTLMIKMFVRQYVDQVFRYGGDEIAVIVPGLDEDHAVSLGSRIVDKVCEKTQSYGIGISIGIACLNVEAVVSLNDFVDMADKKLYEAKKSGKNKVVI
ncbi:MAG: response regulator [Elusimicrobiota bacterium]